MEIKYRKELLESLIWAGTRQGGFQRAKIYSDNATDEIKINFRNEIHLFLKSNLYRKYHNKTVSERILRQQIDDLINLLNKKYGRYLIGNAFQYGNAQKFINLYLKLMWITGEGKMPPHFPVDSVIQKVLPGTSTPWTKMNKSDYNKVIAKAGEMCTKKNISLAEWEALNYFKLINNTK